MPVLILRPSLHRCLFTVASPCLKYQPQPIRRLLITPTATSLKSSPIEELEPPPKFTSLPQQQQQQIDQYLDLLEEWNAKMNLTAIKQREEAYERHVNDSLALLPVIDHYVASLDLGKLSQGGSTQPRLRSIDVGSGAGLPGFMLAIARPEWDFTLLDSLQKRCTFMREVVSSVQVGNVEIECDRAEAAGQNPLLRQAYGLVVARAVAELRVLSELCLPFVAKGGYWIAAKGANPQEEVEQAANAIKLLGGKLIAIHEVDSEAPEGKRTAIVVQKVSNTPGKYPRLPGTPKKTPL